MTIPPIGRAVLCWFAILRGSPRRFICDYRTRLWSVRAVSARTPIQAKWHVHFVLFVPFLSRHNLLSFYFATQVKYMKLFATSTEQTFVHHHHALPHHPYPHKNLSNDIHGQDPRYVQSAGSIVIFFVVSALASSVPPPLCRSGCRTCQPQWSVEHNFATQLIKCFWYCNASSTTVTPKHLPRSKTAGCSISTTAVRIHY